MTFKQLVKSVLPPFLLSVWHSLRRTFDNSVDCLTYAPKGWATRLPTNSRSQKHWDRFIAQERRECKDLIARLQNDQAVLTLDRREHLNYLPFGYVLALAARQKQTLKILDYGGNLGNYYWVGKALLPGVHLEYHSKELPAVAEEGRKLSPPVIWHTSDDCLDQHYDVVMFSASLQYIPDWPDLLRRAAAAARTYLFLSEIATVEHVPGYVALQRYRRVLMLHQQINRSELLGTVQSTGLRLDREFLMAEHPRIRNAPEQPSFRGWLFQRDGDQA